MGIAERKQRFKENTRINIIDAAMIVVKQEGWQALSIRKIADAIEYTTPVIYEHFENKDAILLELMRQGFLRLGNSLKHTVQLYAQPVQRIEAMWLTWWNFAFAEEAYYRLMFGIEMRCASEQAISNMEEAACPAEIFKPVIRELYLPRIPAETEVSATFFTHWSIVHGLIAINLVYKRNSETENRHILVKAIRAINKAIGHP